MVRPLLFLSSLVFCFSCHGQDIQGKTRYALRQFVDDTRMASREVGYSSLPFNKKYSELSAEQKGLFKSQYEEMEEGDEPPYPRGGLKDIFGPIARGQEYIIQTGPVLLDIDVDAAGDAVSARVIKSPSPQATQLVAGIALLVKYKPGVCGGRPCAMSFPIRLNLGVQ